MTSDVVIIHNIISPYKTVLFNAMAKEGIDFNVVYIAATERIREWDIDYTDLEFDYHVLFNSQLEDVSSLGLIKQLWKQLNELNPRVVIIAEYSKLFSWISLAWAKVHGRKIVLWSSTTEEDRKRFWHKEKLKSFFIKNCHLAHVYGSRAHEYLYKLGMPKDQIYITGQVTDNLFFESQCKKARPLRSACLKEMGLPKHNFIYVGRFSDEKNIMMLLEAYKESCSHSEWGLLLIGDGPKRTEIEEFIQTHNLSSIAMPGFIQKNHICDYFSLADVILLPSLSEVWGVVINEAMACGLPAIVSTQCGCYPDLVKPGKTGFAIEATDSKGLSTLMHGISSGEIDLDELSKNAYLAIQDFSPQAAASIIRDSIVSLERTN